MPGLDLMVVDDVAMAEARLRPAGELNPLQKVLNKSKFIEDLPAPEKPLKFETLHKKGSVYYRHKAVGMDGYVEIDGVRVHPLQVFAGQVTGHVGDVAEENIKDIGGRELIPSDECPFKPFQASKRQMFTMMAEGQHERNGHNNKERKETLIMEIPHQYVVTTSTLDDHLIDNIYIDKKGVLKVKIEIKHPEFLHPDFYRYADPLTRLVDNLVQLNMGTGSRAQFYFKGTSRGMDTRELVEILASMNEDFAVDWNAEGRVIRKATQSQRTALGKWLKETVTEVGEITHRYSYLYDELTAEVVGNRYEIKAPMVRPTKPTFRKPANSDEIMQFFFEHKLSKKELTSLLAKGIASGFDVKHTQSKELMHTLKVCSDWGKSEILANALEQVSMAAKFDVMDFLNLTAAIAGASKSGKNPLLLGMHPFAIFDEAKHTDKKVDAAFVDKLKIFHRLDIRAMQQTINTIIRGHQVIILSRVGVSALDTIHDEFITRIVRLHAEKNEPFDKRFRLDDITTALAWFMYETSHKIIEDVLACDTLLERETYFNNLIAFEYIKDKQAEKIKANNFKYSILCNIIRDGAEEMLNATDVVASDYFKYPKEQAVIACKNGKIAFVAKRRLYEYTNNNIAEGTREDILDVLKNANMAHTQGQVTVYPLKTESSKSVAFVYAIDEEELRNPSIPESISSMSYDQVVTRVAEMKGLLSPVMWSILAKHLINISEKIEAVGEDLGGLDEFTK